MSNNFYSWTFAKAKEGPRTVNLQESWPNRIIQKVLAYVNNSHI